MPLSATRTLVLMPVAIALNIVLGSTVQQVLKLPIYLDSLGTIVTGVLAGPLAGMVTGALTDLIWAYVLPPPLGAPTAGPFAITAAVIGLLAGLWGWLGFFRSRRSFEPRTLWTALAATAIAAAAVYFTFNQAYAGSQGLALSEVVFGIVVVAFAALAGWALFIRRDAGAVSALAAGFLTGVVSAVVSAPIAAYVFGGVTGFGGDVIIAALRAAGASVYQAVLTQSLFSDPLDKMVTCLIAFFVLAALPRRVLARFPNGDRLTEPAA
jgi:energy-coupling factor transport system substrate-specific component